MDMDWIQLFKVGVHNRWYLCS